MIYDQDEKLALLKALADRIKPQLEDAKAEARTNILQAYEEDGNDRHAIRVNGQKVGEVGISYSKGKPVIFADKMPEALCYLRMMGLTEEVPAKGWEKRFSKAGDSVVDTESGEVVTWCQWQDSAPKSVAIRGCKPADVLNAFGSELTADTVYGLLEGVN